MEHSKIFESGTKRYRVVLLRSTSDTRFCWERIPAISRSECNRFPKKAARIAQAFCQEINTKNDEQRIRELEAEGMTTSDAQAVVDAERRADGQMSGSIPFNYDTS